MWLAATYWVARLQNGIIALSSIGQHWFRELGKHRGETLPRRDLEVRRGMRKGIPKKIIFKLRLEN